VGVGEGAGLGEGGVGRGVGGAGVVDRGDVEDVVDCISSCVSMCIIGERWTWDQLHTDVSVLESDLVCTDDVVDCWHQRSIEVLRAG
jgi:hypothetical protein